MKTNSVEHLFMCLLPIYISSFVKCLFQSLSFLNYLLIIELEEFLYILDSSSLSGVCMVSISSQSVASFFVCFTLPFEKQKI